MIYFDENKQAYGYKIENALCIVEEEKWNEFSTLTLGKEYDVTSDGIVDLRKSPEYIAEQEMKEKEITAQLSLTAADVERALYKAFGKDFDDIISMVQELQPEGLDIKALKIELKANNFYRGNPYIDAVGNLLGITSLQLDEFFETNDYTKLLPR